MATEAKMAERIECVVDTKAQPTGLNQTIALLRTFEQILDRVNGKMTGAARTPLMSVAGIQRQIQEAQKRGAGLAGKDLAKVFEKEFKELKIDPRSISKSLGNFQSELAKQGKRMGDIFAGSIRQGIENVPFRSTGLAAQFVHSVINPIQRELRERSRALSNILSASSTPAHPTPQQVAAAAQAPPKVTIARVEPAAQRQGALPTPGGQVTIPANIVSARQARAMSVVKKGTTTLPLKFEDALDQAAYLATQAADREIRKALGDWAESKMKLARDEFFEHGKKVQRAVRSAAKGAKKGPVTILGVSKAFTMPMEPILGPAPGPTRAFAAAAAGGFGMGMFTARPAPRTAATPGTAAVVVAGAPEGQIRLRVQGSQIVAELVSPIQLRIPGTMVHAVVEGQMAGVAPATAAAGGGGGAGGSRTPPVVAPGGGGRGPVPGPSIAEQAGEIRREITETAKGAVTKITTALKPGETVTRTMAPEEKVRKTRRVTGLRSPEAEFEFQVQQALKDELSQIKGRGKILKTAATPETLENLAAETRATAQRLQAEFNRRAQELAGKATTSGERRAARAVIDPRQADIDRRVSELNSTARVLEMKSAEMRVRLAQNEQAALNKVRETGARTRVRLDKEIQQQTLLESKRREATRMQQAVALRAAEAQAVIDRLQAEGFQLVGGKPSIAKKTTRTRDVESETYRFRRSEGDQIREQVIRIERAAAAPAAPGAPSPTRGRVVSAFIEPEKFSQAPLTSKSMGLVEYAGAKFKALATYAGEAMLLYGALDEARKAMESMIRTGLEVARLEQVFKGVGGSARDLIDDVLELAAIEGKTAEEAQTATVSWARLGLTRSQANEAVRVTLQAANLAMADSARITEQLQTVFLAYNLRVKELAPVLGAVAALSYQFSVNQGEIFDALSKTASVAKQTGLPLEELIGILGVLISKTGQTGAVVGNTVTVLLASLARLDTQQYLRKQLGIEATVGGGQDVKNMNELIRELIISYQGLNQQERNVLATRLLGSRQISRLSAFFDAYVQTQTAAVNAQLRLNAAEEGSAKIRATLHSRLIGLRAEFDRFLASFDNATGFTANLADIANGFGNILRTIRAINNFVSTDALAILAPNAGSDAIKEVNRQRSQLMKMLGTPFGLYNVGSDFWGLTASGTKDEIGEINDEMIKSSGIIKANTTSINLYKLAIDSLLKGTADEISNRARQLGELDTLVNPEQFKVALKLAVDARDQDEVKRILNEQIEASLLAVKNANAKLDSLSRDRKTKLQARIDVLEKGWFRKTSVTQKEVERLREMLAEEDKGAVKRYSEQDVLEKQRQSDIDATLAKDVRHLTLLESQKQTLEEIAGLYRAIPKATPLDEHFARIATYSAQVDFLRNSLKEIGAEIDRQTNLEAYRMSDTGATGATKGTTSVLSLRSNQETTEEQLTRAEASLNAARLAGQNALTMARTVIAQQIGAAQAKSFEFGDTDVDRLRNKEAQLIRQIEKRKSLIDSMGSGIDRQSELVIQAEQLNELVRTRLDLELARFNVIKQEYEFNKKLLTSGPADLLQRIVAQRISQKGGPIPAAQFMALSPQMREMVLEQPQLARYQGPVAAANRVLAPMQQQMSVYDQLERERMIKGGTTGDIVNLGGRSLMEDIAALRAEKRRETDRILKQIEFEGNRRLYESGPKVAVPAIPPTLAPAFGMLRGSPVPRTVGLVRDAAIGMTAPFTAPFAATRPAAPASEQGPSMLSTAIMGIMAPILAPFASFFRDKSLDVLRRPVAMPDTPRRPALAEGALSPVGTQFQSVEQIAQQFADKMGLVLAAAPDQSKTAPMDSLELGKANLALAQFTQTVNEGAGSMSALTETVNTLASAVNGVIGELDDMGSKLATLIPERNSGAKLHYAD